MNKRFPKLKFTISSIHFRAFCASSSSSSTTTTLTQTQNLSDPQIIVPGKKRRVKASDTQFKENWLASLSNPFPEKTHLLNGEHEPTHQNDGSKWVLGIDPDVSGAVALLKTHGSVCSAQDVLRWVLHDYVHNIVSIFQNDVIISLLQHMQVFDSPHVKILVGKNKTTRRRLDAKSVVELVCGFRAPIGTTAYIEQSLPYPQDGKQGWWSGGFGYGLWIGILVASGFSVIPVPSFTWKAKFELNGTTKSMAHPCKFHLSRSSESSQAYTHYLSVVALASACASRTAFSISVGLSLPPVLLSMPASPVPVNHHWPCTHSRDSDLKSLKIVLAPLDDSRRLASTLFPSMTSMLSRKKDHGRAEALLIAAYGQDQNKFLEPSCCDTILENLEN
ncbi:Holliday junction resolvase MOC1, chloroplastic [Glycine soja]